MSSLRRFALPLIALLALAASPAVLADASLPDEPLLDAPLPTLVQPATQLA